MPDEQRCTHCGKPPVACYEVRHGAETEPTHYSLCEEQYRFVGAVIDDLTTLYRDGAGVIAK